MKKFIDIGANLTDPMFNGLYHGIKRHEPDLFDVLGRAWSSGVTKVIATGGNLEESERALNIAKTHENIFATVGCHPTRCDEFEASGSPEGYLDDLSKLIKEERPKVVAVGECGLDYNRFQFCGKDIQLKYFEKQLSLCHKFDLPAFLHCRDAASDLVKILSKYSNIRGVVHSFDGTLPEAQQFIDMGFYIGLNGCSLKTNENLEVVKSLPKEKLLLETDSPWCEIRPTHAGSKYVKTQFPSVKKEKWKNDHLVKSRNEPCAMVQVFEVVSAVRSDDPDVLCQQIYENTCKLFFP